MIPKPLLDDIVNGKCLPFIGAGFSLNAEVQNGKQMPTWNQLTKILASDLQIPKTEPLEIYQEYEKEFGRPKLIETISENLHIHDSKAGTVHKLFTEIKSFDLIYTTNFDVLLEESYKERGIPFKSIVGPYQFAEFAGHKAINIVKMHGDVNHSEYMIITKEDYDNYLNRYDAFAIHLSGLLMTRTPLFIGYSLKDPNFLQIKQIIESKMKKAIRKGYVVLFNAFQDEIEDYEKMNLSVINLQSQTKSNNELLLDFLNEIYSYEALGEMKREFEISTNKKILVYGELLEINGRVKKITEKLIPIKIVDSDGNTVLDENIELENNRFNKQIVLTGQQWKINSDYYVIAEYGSRTVNYEFYISEPFEIVIQTDKSVYIQGSDMILTIINPNSIIGIPINVEIFGPSGLVYKNSIPVDPEGNGIYQEIVLVDGKGWSRTRGEEYEIIAEYGGREARLTIFTSNFGATIELDQKVYTWTDKVYITVVAPDHNRNSDKQDSIFVTIATRKGKLPNYRLIETGNDTGIFTGEIILTGFKDHKIMDHTETREKIGIAQGNGPSDGLMATSNVDAITVSFEFSEDEVVTGSALILWNIGEIQWSQSAYKPIDQAIVRVIDPDMNLNPNKIDAFKIRAWSDSDAVGIEIDVIETNEATGIFEGEILLGKKSGDGMLKVMEGDTITAEYIDRTLPSPYSENDSLTITSTAQISSKDLLPPLERFSLKNLVAYNEKGEIVNKIPVGKNITFSIDVLNNQDFEQTYGMILQIIDRNGITVHGDSLTASLEAKQSFVHTLNWSPKNTGIFDAQFFVWKAVTEPEALTTPSSLQIQVADE